MSGGKGGSAAAGMPRYPGRLPDSLRVLHFSAFNVKFSHRPTCHSDPQHPRPHPSPCTGRQGKQRRAREGLAWNEPGAAAIPSVPAFPPLAILPRSPSNKSSTNFKARRCSTHPR
jgi:hypothetical protein